MGAVLTAGDAAVLSHRSAATLWGLGRFPHMEVTAATHRARPGIQIHTSTLPRDEVTEERRIPVTTVPRTLLDLAAVLPAHHVERAMNEAEVRRLTDDLSLVDLVARYPGRRGIRTVKAILKTGPALTRSELEARFVAFVRKAGLPIPLLNAPLLGFECDCLWPDHGLVVELDGHATHRTRRAFEEDRARDRALQVDGWQVIRVTWRHLHFEQQALAAHLRAILSR